MRQKYFLKAGDVFGLWTVIAIVEGGAYRTLALCRCECGTERRIRPGELVVKGTRSCARCAGRLRRGWRKRFATVGDRKGRLTIIEIDLHMPGTQQNPSGRRAVRVACTCGTIKITPEDDFIQGRTQSCGCLHREVAAQRGRANATHGLSKHPHYGRWKAMMLRCYDPEHPQYADWGGRGIRVCDAWHDVRNFIAWTDEHPCPEGMSLDRRDNDGDYSPDNCGWATRSEQIRNRRPMRGLTDEELQVIDAMRAGHKVKVSRNRVPKRQVGTRLAWE